MKRFTFSLRTLLAATFLTGVFLFMNFRPDTILEIVGYGRSGEAGIEVTVRGWPFSMDYTYPDFNGMKFTHSYVSAPAIAGNTLVWLVSLAALYLFLEYKFPRPPKKKPLPRPRNNPSRNA